MTVFFDVYICLKRIQPMVQDSLNVGGEKAARVYTLKRKVLLNYIIQIKSHAAFIAKYLTVAKYNFEIKCKR